MNLRHCTVACWMAGTLYHDFILLLAEWTVRIRFYPQSEQTFGQAACKVYFLASGAAVVALAVSTSK